MSNPPRNPSRNDYSNRLKVLNRARALARSGQHPGYESIVAELEHMEGFTGALARLHGMRAQINHLCELARAGRTRFDIPGRNKPTTQLPR
jgi:hypothetical protein